MTKEKAELIIHQKLTSSKGLISELSIWKLKASERYPDGIRYRLILVDPASGFVHLLFDNHWPKGHHVHVGEKEEPYHFTSVVNLVQEFREKSDAIERSLS